MTWCDVVRELRNYLDTAEGIPPKTYTAISLAVFALEAIASYIRCGSQREDVSDE